MTQCLSTKIFYLQIDKKGLNIAAIYRPLNNVFLNSIMEILRTKYICKNQIKKGIGGLRELIKFNKQNYSELLKCENLGSRTEIIQKNKKICWDRTSFSFDFSISS